jgi:hypothetical protein
MPSCPVLPTHRIRRALALLLAAATFAVPAAFAQEDEEVERTRNFLELQHTLSTDFVTPHTAWAKPFAGGKLRAVFFVNWCENSTDAREIIELMQRLDLEANAVYGLNSVRLLGDGRPDWYGGEAQAGTKRALRLLNQPNDLLFINQLSLEVLGKEVQARIFRKVSAGTGLVLVGGAESSPFPEARPVEPKPIDPKDARFYTVGQGRMVMLPKREKIEFQLGWETQFDYQMERQIRALLWAARREPRAVIEIQVPQTITRASLPGKATLMWQGLPSKTGLKLSLRRSDGETRSLPALTARGAKAASVPLPIMREGNYHLDVLASSGRTVQTWATAPFPVEADRHVEAVQLDRDWSEPGDQAKGQVRLSGSLKPQDVLVVRLVDNYNRILAEQRLPATVGSVPFHFSIASWMPMLLRVDAILHDGSDEVSGNYAYLRVTQRHQDQFNFVVWNCPSGDLAPYGVQNLARCGTTAILQGGNPPLFLAQSDLSFIPYAASFRASSHTITAMLNPTNGVLKSGCVYDQQKMTETVRQTVNGCQRARESGVLAYSLGDENAVRASCLSPQCLQAYQRYLEEQYGAIDALNQEWNTNYKSFAEIELLAEGELPAADAPKWFQQYFAQRQELHRTDSEGAKGADLEKQIAFGNINDEMRALQAENYPRWYDRQAFQCYTYFQWCKAFQRAFREMDPKARTGFEGTDSFSLRRLTTRSRQGGDLDLFVRDLDYFGPYGGPANHVVRSIAPQGFPMGNWMGYAPETEQVLHDYWGQITDGMNTVQWWRWDNFDGYHGFLMPSFAPFPAVRELLADTQVIRDGLGTLLMRSRMCDDGVAMLYSMPSTHIAFFDGNQTYGDYKRDHERWISLIHGAGLQFRYVTDRMLRLGEFDAPRYKVLLLPLVFALGRAEADVIRAFVRNGGTVIADVRPALYDGHCKPLENGLLDDVFGIQRTGKQDAAEIDRLAVNDTLNGVKLQMKWGNWHGHDIYPAMKVDPAVRLATGKALGRAYQVHYWAALDTPVCIVNEFGKGRAVLLNFSVFNAPAGPLLSGLLAAAGVQPAIRVATPKGGYPKDVTVTRWSNGQIDLVSLFGTHEGSVSVTLPASRAVCDLKARKHLGETAQFATTLRPNRAAFFALLPRAALSPELKLAAAARRGDIVSASLRIPNAAGQHAIRLSARTPSGQPAEWFNQTLIVGDQPVHFALPFAGNDPAGDWQIQATDLYASPTTAAKVTLH